MDLARQQSHSQSSLPLSPPQPVTDTRLDTRTVDRLTQTQNSIDDVRDQCYDLTRPRD